MHSHVYFYVGAGDLNPGPYVCTAITEPFSQPCQVANVSRAEGTVFAILLTFCRKILVSKMSTGRSNKRSCITVQMPKLRKT